MKRRTSLRKLSGLVTWLIAAPIAAPIAARAREPASSDQSAAPVKAHDAALRVMLEPTPSDPTGPYFPSDWQAEHDEDLTRIGVRRYASGQSLVLAGRVLDRSGNPIPSALVRLWQSDENGRYRHPADDGEGPAIRGFQGYGQTRSAASGAYSFHTIKPAPYSGRPAHLHIAIVADSYQPLTTQLYFPGESDEPRWLYRTFGGFSRTRENLILKLESANTPAMQARFDFVLQSAGS